MKLLIPADGSPDAQAALRHVIALKLAGLAVQAVLVNVQASPSLYEVMTMPDVDRLRELRRDAGADLLAPAQAMLDGAGIGWESEVAGADATAATLVDLCETYGCDGIVMGARGMSDAGEAGLGPVVHHLLDHAPVPVTVVRAASPR